MKNSFIGVGLGIGTGPAPFFLFMLVCLTACKCLGNDPLAHGWKKIDSQPLRGTLILQEAERSACIWRVDERNRQIAVSRVQSNFRQRPQEIRTETPQGTLVGTDRGEWGGNLTLTSRNGKPLRKLLDQNVLQILQGRDGFLIITGSLSLNEGALWLYSGAGNGEWTIARKADLRGYPLAAFHASSGTWLVDAEGVYLIDNAQRVQQNINTPWLDLHPNSVRVDERGVVYVGMQAFVAKFTHSPDGYVTEWFTGDDCLN